MTALSTWFRTRFDNPVLRREIRQITRRGIFEWVVFVLTVAMTLIIASIGGGEGTRPAQAGRALFQTFFGIANALVMVAGPAVAASSISAEREGRTLEALVLTGLGPQRVTRGKFVAAITNVGAYVVALAPVGALPFLFGGISATAMLLGFGMLFVTTALAALIGLAISARMSTTRSALIASVIAGIGFALAMHEVLGNVVGTVVCRSFGFARPGTIWLPVLLAEANIGWSERALLLIAPLLLATMVGWFLLEVCTAGLADPTADRTTGIKRWYAASVSLVAALGITAILVAPSRGDRADATITTTAGALLFAVFGAFVFQGDDVVAPRRVRLMWAARKASWLRRFFGPGAAASAALQILSTALLVGLLGIVGLFCVLADEYGPASAPIGVILVGPPIALQALFIIGVSTYLRVRWGIIAARVVLALLLIVLFLAPYAVTSILGSSVTSGETWTIPIASLSPQFTLDMARRAATDRASIEEVLAVGAASVGYFIVGMLALIAALRAAGREARARDGEAARIDARIAAEDRAGTAAPTAEAPSTTQAARKYALPDDAPRHAAVPAPAAPVVAHVAATEPPARNAAATAKTEQGAAFSPTVALEVPPAVAQADTSFRTQPLGEFPASAATVAMEAAPDSKRTPPFGSKAVEPSGNGGDKR